MRLPGRAKRRWSFSGKIFPLPLSTTWTSTCGKIADFYKSTNQDYIVHCEIREGKTVLLDVSLSVPDREQAEAMCSQWEKKNQDIYSYVMKTLMTSDS